MAQIMIIEDETVKATENLFLYGNGNKVKIAKGRRK